MTTAEEITVLVKAAMDSPGVFHPGAFLDDRLDCIRVIAKDCSVMETRINEHLTVLEDNYASDSDSTPYVGFTIKGARHFCAENGFSLDAPIQVSKVLDAVLRSFPGVLVEVFVNAIARPLVKNKRIDKVEVFGGSETWSLPARVSA